jgi:hypothetical protein
MGEDVRLLPHFDGPPESFPEGGMLGYPTMYDYGMFGPGRGRGRGRGLERGRGRGGRGG